MSNSISVQEIYNPGSGDVSITVNVPAGSNGVAVMDKAKQEDSKFDYTYTQYNFGIMVDSIGGHDPPSDSYWKLLVGQNSSDLQASSVGISDYNPPDNSIIKWVIA